MTGLVVAPGFIDLHAHGQTTSDLQIKAQDGVTTALDMEVGVYPVAEWYARKEGTGADQLRRHGGPHLGALCGVSSGAENRPQAVRRLGDRPARPRARWREQDRGRRAK